MKMKLYPDARIPRYQDISYEIRSLSYAYHGYSAAKNLKLEDIFLLQLYLGQITNKLDRDILQLVLFVYL